MRMVGRGGPLAASRLRLTMTRWFHYAHGAALLGIVRAARILCANAGAAAGERPAVWLTRRESWEPTATVFDDQFGYGRIEVAEAVARWTWDDHVRRSGIAQVTAAALSAIARDRGSNPAEWRVSYRKHSCQTLVRGRNVTRWSALGAAGAGPLGSPSGTGTGSQRRRDPRDLT